MSQPGAESKPARTLRWCDRKEMPLLNCAGVEQADLSQLAEAKIVGSSIG